MANYKIQVHKTESGYEVRNSIGEKVLVEVDRKKGKAAVSACDGGSFVFEKTDPSKIERIGELIAEAGRVAAGELLRDEPEVF